MNALFTIEAGEFIVGNLLEKQYGKRGLRVWIPAKDTGIDLLVTNKDNSKAVSLQIKASRNYPDPAKYGDGVLAFGWVGIKRKKLLASTADYWVLVVMPSSGKESQCIIIPTDELKKRITAENKPFYPLVLTRLRQLAGF